MQLSCLDVNLEEGDCNRINYEHINHYFSQPVSPEIELLTFKHF